MSTYAATASLAISAGTSPSVVGYASPTFAFPTSPALRVSIVLTTGANTIVPPAGASLFVLVPPSGSTVTKTLKGLAADTGYAIAPALPLFLPLAASPASIVITAGAGETCDGYWW